MPRIRPNRVQHRSRLLLDGPCAVGRARRGEPEDKRSSAAAWVARPAIELEPDRREALCSLIIAIGRSPDTVESWLVVHERARPEHARGVRLGGRALRRGASRRRRVGHQGEDVKPVLLQVAAPERRSLVEPWILERDVAQAQRLELVLGPPDLLAERLGDLVGRESADRRARRRAAGARGAGPHCSER